MGFFFNGGFEILFFIVFGLIICTFLCVLISNIARWNKNNRSPVLTVEAKIVSRRTDVTHHHHHNSSSTRYHHARLELMQQLEWRQHLFLFKRGLQHRNTTGSRQQHNLEVGCELRLQLGRQHARHRYNSHPQHQLQYRRRHCELQHHCRHDL